jgi:hypothetical protein
LQGGAGLARHQECGVHIHIKFVIQMSRSRR